MPDWIIQGLTLLATAGVGSAFTAWYKALQDRRTAAEGNGLTKRRDLIAEYDGLLEQLKGDMTALRTRMDGMEKELDEVKGLNNTLTRQNSALVAFIFRLTAIMRAGGLEDRIPKDVPEGIGVQL
jgi:hypothetical protein